MTRFLTITALLALVSCASKLTAPKQSVRKPATVENYNRYLRRDRYVHNLRGMWLAYSMAKATLASVQDEKTSPPFLSDSDWEKSVNYTFNSVWGQADGAEDRYLLLNKIATLDSLQFSKQELESIDISALSLLGAFTPGGPNKSTEKISSLSDESKNGVEHWKFFSALHSLGPIVNGSLSNRDKVLVATEMAREQLIGDSAAAAVFDFIKNDFMEKCPEFKSEGCADWAGTRDKLYLLSREKPETPVRFASALIALFYGQGNLKKTIRISTLVGWGAREECANVASFLGLMNGYDWVVEHFRGQKLSDRYATGSRQNSNLRDFLPGDPAADDTFLMMSIRMIPFVEEGVKSFGGKINGLYYVTPALGTVPAPLPAVPKN